MVFITRNHAFCIFYQLQFNQENVAKALESFEPLKNEFEICYLTDPTVPVMALKPRVYGNSFLLKEYLNEEPHVKEIKTVPKLDTKPQILQFLNEAYNAEPGLGEAYTLKSISLKEIFAQIVQRTAFFDNKTFNSFLSFVGKNKVEFLSSNQHIKIADSQGKTSTYWKLYILKDDFLDNLSLNIIKYDQQYKDYLQQLKNDGFVIVGYVRKSPGDTPLANRKRLITKMITKIKNRSLTDHIYVSKESLANQPLNQRDKSDTIFEGSDGTTQDLLLFLESQNMKVVLITLDYAGFTTNVQDLVEFVRKYETIKKIVVDRFPAKADVEVFERETLLHDKEAVMKFDCRSSPVQRSS